MFDRLKEDIQCVKDRDPAARNAVEIMFLYPGFKAVRMYRKAHWFFKHRMFFTARWISQRCVKKTNIEIHPGAQIGKRLFIDHGTGVVILYGELIEDNSAGVLFSTAAPARTRENATRLSATMFSSARVQRCSVRSQSETTQTLRQVRLCFPKFRRIQLPSVRRRGLLSRTGSVWIPLIRCIFRTRSLRNSAHSTAGLISLKNC